MSRRRLDRHKNRKRALEPKIRPEQLEADPTDYLTKASSYLRRCPFDSVIIYYRVSTAKQHRNHNYAWQESCLRRYCLSAGIAILDELYEEGQKGHGVTSDARPSLARAVELAKAHSVPILAASTDRFLRPEGFDKYNQSAQPSVEEFDVLATLAPVPLLTLLAPDTKWTDVKSFQKIESAKLKRRNKPMRRSERKELLVDEARELSRWKLSCREIAEELEARERPYVSHKTIWKWLNEPA